ncbi:hypothetical protein VSDG_02852 [Cytospora chrysosperma]|uniref:DUF1772-domain-containing protein n=1 Tax=Cytospora chrysosperma TaxID=252740 RepID=A0A423WCJ4_CYTCH|nr:hypothetical protein VSDG_02852 [Valsa sordida]
MSTTASSANMSSVTSLVAIALTLVSGYATYQSTASILNIRKYEEKAERAAEWSNTAKKRLWDTRYTIGAGFASCLLSLSTATAYIFVSSEPSISKAPVRNVWPAVLAVALRFGASRYMYKFWSTKAMIPRMDQYNAAISQSMEVINVLNVLSIGWGILAVVEVLPL